MQPSVSIIIPAFNEEALLPLCLASLRALDYPKELVEIIVVDNGSSDRTFEIASQGADRALLFPKAAVPKVRNFGVANSQGTIIAFLDADCTVPAGWLTAALSTIGGQDCIAGAPHRNPPDAPWLANAWFSKRVNGIRDVHSLSCGNLFVTRKLFSDLGGFDESLTTGEDTELCARALKVARVIENPDIIAYHHGIPRTLGQFFRREIWHGLGAFGTFRVNWFDPPLIGTVVFLLFHLAALAGLFVMLCGGTACLLLLAALGVVLLLLGTLVYRRRAIRSFVHGAQLFLLYYLYYAGRSVSLFLLLFRKGFYHHNDKREAAEAASASDARKTSKPVSGKQE